MAKDQTRRNFLLTAPLAAASLPLVDKLAFAAEGAQAAAPEPFQVFPAEKLADAMKMLAAKPGNDSLFANKALPFTIVMTTEEKKSRCGVRVSRGARSYLPDPRRNDEV